MTESPLISGADFSALFRLLDKNADIITQMFDDGAIDDDPDNPSLNELKQRRVVFLTGKGTLRLDPRLLHFLNVQSNTEGHRYINAGCIKPNPRSSQRNRFVFELQGSI